MPENKENRENNGETRAFSELGGGAVFRADGNLYLKLYSALKTPGGFPANAVLTENGTSA